MFHIVYDFYMRYTPVWTSKKEYARRFQLPIYLEHVEIDLCLRVLCIMKKGYKVVQVPQEEG
jgi:hypothetical protein